MATDVTSMPVVVHLRAQRENAMEVSFTAPAALEPYTITDARFVVRYGVDQDTILNIVESEEDGTWTLGGPGSSCSVEIPASATEGKPSGTFMYGISIMASGEWRTVQTGQFFMLGSPSDSDVVS